MFPVSEDFFCVKKTCFRSTAAIKQQRKLTILANPTMVCSYRSYCLDLPVALVCCQMKGCESRFHHVCQGDYMAMHKIDLDGADLNICRDCVDKLWMGGKPRKLKKVQHSTVYRTDELGEVK